ncbi:MAG: ABC transporter ATP-binding protein [Enterococcus avium]
MDDMIRLVEISKKYDQTEVIKKLDLYIHQGEFLTLLGPSGCGKTTLLRMIAGFEQPTAGTILLNQEEVVNLPPYKRKINTVFQNYALFPHMTIEENISFGLKMNKLPKKEQTKRVKEMLQMVQLEGYEQRNLDQLSGGQKQRVAIARALVNYPKVLLLDEPLSALDLKLRKMMQIELKRLQRKLGITFVYVTHDQEEALTMSDRIAIMNKGRIEQLAEPREIYENPASTFVADFIGESNIFEGVVKEVSGKKAIITVENGELAVETETNIEPQMLVNVALRPEKIQLSMKRVPGFTLVGLVKEHYFAGNMNKTVVTMTDGMEVKVNSLAEQKLLPVGTEVYPYWQLSDANVMNTVGQEVFQAIEHSDFRTVRIKGEV